MIKIGIIGGTGYTAGELIRIFLYQHPEVIIKSIVSKSMYDNPITLVHQDLLGDTKLKFSKKLDENVDITFLCLGHGYSKKELLYIKDNIKIIDLSEDFRINDCFKKRRFIYGLPELYKCSIQKSKNIANPGCFATSILLSILPLLKKKKIDQHTSIHISAITGSTGSGKKLSYTNNFSWRNNNISCYKIFTHQHLNEIKKVIKNITNIIPKIYFVPYRGNFSRGIISTTYVDSDISLEENKKIYIEYYAYHPFIHISEHQIDIKQVINTNKCILHLIKQNDKLIIISIIDNLIKGASGQAIQNMNIMFNLNETYGLRTKSIRL